MNVKKEVAIKITAILEQELSGLRKKIDSNRREINHRAEQNAILKRERKALRLLIHEWDNK